MSGKKYKNIEKDVKILLISPNGTIFVTDNSNDNKNMRKEYNLKQYREDEKCKYHIDYLVVLLNKYFQNNINYKQFLTTRETTDVYKILNQFLLDGYIVFLNSTLYDNISYLLNGSQGELLINYKKITSFQLLALKKIESLLKTITQITINKYLDYPKNYLETLTTPSNQISELLIEKPKILIKSK